MTIDHTEQVAISLTLAIRGGNLPMLSELIAANPELVRAKIVRGPGPGYTTPLHIATDWPGFFPEGPAVVRLLIAAGADPNVRTAPGKGGETPLHYAASSDDFEVAEALIDGGSDLDTPDGSIGTPLANALGYGCHHVARLLVARGAKVESLWEAAALGLSGLAAEMVAADPPPTAEEINHAFFQACSAGQRRMAEYFFRLGADVNWTPDYSPNRRAVDVAAGTDTQRGILVDWLQQHGAVPGDDPGETAPEQTDCQDP